MTRTSQDELGELAGQVVSEPELPSQRVVLAELRHRHDGHRAAQEAAPLLDAVERTRARSIGVELDAEVGRDELDVAPFVNRRQIGKDGRECPEGPARAATVLGRSERGYGRGVQAAAQ